MCCFLMFRLRLTKEVPGSQCWRRDQLICKNFLADIINAIANKIFVEPPVPIVHKGTHGASDCKHATYRGRNTVRFHYSRVTCVT